MKRVIWVPVRSTVLVAVYLLIFGLPAPSLAAEPDCITQKETIKRKCSSVAGITAAQCLELLDTALPTDIAMGCKDKPDREQCLEEAAAAQRSAIALFFKDTDFCVPRSGAPTT